MGTRGTWGYAVDGAVKMAYNQFDSYPSGLGEDILAHAKWVVANPDYAEKAIRDLRMVTHDTPPTVEDIEHCKPWTDLGVGERSTSDWYCLLRRTQGNPEAVLAAGIMLDAGTWPADSLFCEYGYVIDLDGRRFEYYEGFQKSPHSDGRFASLEPVRDSGCYQIRMAKSWPLDELPENLDDLEGDDEDAAAVSE